MARSRRLTTFREFVMDKALRPEEAAGFRVWLRGERCATDEEWETLLSDYRNRELAG